MINASKFMIKVLKADEINITPANWDYLKWSQDQNYLCLFVCFKVQHLQSYNALKLLETKQRFKIYHFSIFIVF